MLSTLPSSALMIYFQDYEHYHQTRGNKKTHLLGVPLVVFSLIGLLSTLILWQAQPDSLFYRIDLGIILAFMGAAFSLKIDFKLGIPFTLYIYLNYLIARHLPTQSLIILQVLGWTFQLVGHYYYEKKSPAFLTTLEHLFVGPLWVFAWAIGYYKPAGK